MTVELVAGILVWVLAVLLRLLPEVKEWWGGLTSWVKFALILGLSLGVPWLAVGAACLGIDVGLQATCVSSGQGVWDIFALGFGVFTGSQITDRFLKPGGLT